MVMEVPRDVIFVVSSIVPDPDSVIGKLCILSQLRTKVIERLQLRRQPLRHCMAVFVKQAEQTKHNAAIDDGRSAAVVPELGNNLEEELIYSISRNRSMIR